MTFVAGVIVGVVFGIFIGLSENNTMLKEQYSKGKESGFNEGFKMAFKRATERYDSAEKKLLGLEAKFERKYGKQGTYCCFLIHKPAMKKIKLEDEEELSLSKRLD